MLSVGGVVLAMVLIIGVGFLIQRDRDTSTDVAAPAAGRDPHGSRLGRNRSRSDAGVPPQSYPPVHVAC